MMLRKNSDSDTKQKRIVAVGSVTLDSLSVVNERADDKKIPGNNKIRPGGGGFNFFSACLAISNVYGINLDAKLVTKFGQPRVSDRTMEGDLDRIDDISNHDKLEKMLDLYGIKIIDAMKGKQHKIPFNNVIEHNKGRDMTLPPKVGPF